MCGQDEYNYELKKLLASRSDPHGKGGALGNNAYVTGLCIVCICIYIYIHIHICMYVCMYVRMYN
jgi:hypothetical protein